MNPRSIRPSLLSTAVDYLFVTKEGRNLFQTRKLNILRVIGDRRVPAPLFRSGQAHSIYG
ncbi:hypothetical protein ACFLV7_01630 [Chloroflexota bacterium]